MTKKKDQFNQMQKDFEATMRIMMTIQAYAEEMKDKDLQDAAVKIILFVAHAAVRYGLEADKYTKKK